MTQVILNQATPVSTPINVTNPTLLLGDSSVKSGVSYLRILITSGGTTDSVLVPVDQLGLEGRYSKLDTTGQQVELSLSIDEQNNNLNANTSMVFEILSQ